MSKPARLARVVAAAGVTAALLSTAGAPTAVARPAARSTSSGHSYTCSNKGGAANHTVDCSGLITVNKVLNATTVNIDHIKVLSDNQLKNLQVDLVNVSDNDVNLDVNTQLIDLEKRVIVTYLQKFGTTLTADKTKVCAPTLGHCL